MRGVGESQAASGETTAIGSRNEPRLQPAQLSQCHDGPSSFCFWVDPERELTFSFLSTGLMEDSRHIERIGRLSDMVLAAVTH